MARDCGGLPSRAVHVDGMIPAFPQEFTTVGLEMLNEFAPASSREAERLADDVLRAEGFLSEGAVGLQDESHGLRQVGPSFIERLSLGIGARELFDKADIPFAHLFEYCRELELH